MPKENRSELYQGKYKVFSCPNKTLQQGWQI